MINFDMRHLSFLNYAVIIHLIVAYVVIYIFFSFFFENIYPITSYSKGYNHIFCNRDEVFAISKLT